VTEHARTLGITIHRGHRPTPLDETQLREQYLTRKRSTQAIAGDLGTDDETVRLRLHQLGIPLRPAGVHSRTVMTSKIDTPVPPDIRAAAEHTLHGWQRLHRFQITAAFPNLQTAAAYLGAQPNALLRQLQRLERDIGHPLIHRSAGSKPHSPTTRGHALLRHLKTPPVQTLLHAAVPAHQTKPMPDAAALAHATATITRRRRPSPITPYNDIAVERIRIHTPTLALLRHLLAHPDQEFYGAQILATTTMTGGTLYPQLNRLEQAGWLTSRPEHQHAWTSRAPAGRGPGRRRTYYSLTTEGRKAATHELQRRRQNPTENHHRHHQHPSRAEENDRTAGRNR
jgi:DNA-binding PadR family transcriptional regulator